MRTQTKLLLYVVILPFVISASVEFLPAWLYWPIAVIAGLVWFGALIELGKT